MFQMLINATCYMLHATKDTNNWPMVLVVCKFQLCMWVVHMMKDLVGETI